MAEFFKEPINKSFLSNNKFEFSIQRLPNFTFFVQSVNIPSLTLFDSRIASPFTRVQVPGNQIDYGELSLTVIMDEDFHAWFELYNWMTNLGNPESYDKRGTLTNTAGRINSVTSDASLIVKTNSNNPNFIINFKDVFPVSMSDLTFSTTESQDFLTISSTFSYTSYSARKYS